LASRTRKSVSLVAYGGTAPALNDLIEGHIDFLCEQVVSVAPQIAAGTIKAYAIFCGDRLRTLPDLPTAKEAGLDCEMSIWAGVFDQRGGAVSRQRSNGPR
jgi:tripartite-type tricarboxylate transporter receptor subunit TctC